MNHLPPMLRLTPHVACVLQLQRSKSSKIEGDGDLIGAEV